MSSAAHPLTCNQFHQHFTSSFCVDILSPKNQTVFREKLRKGLLYEKDAQKMLMTLTPVQSKFDIPCEFRRRLNSSHKLSSILTKQFSKKQDRLINKTYFSVYLSNYLTFCNDIGLWNLFARVCLTRKTTKIVHSHVDQYQLKHSKGWLKWRHKILDTFNNIMITYTLSITIFSWKYLIYYDWSFIFLLSRKLNF